MAFHWLASMRRSAIREASTPACKNFSRLSAMAYSSPASMRRSARREASTLPLRKLLEVGSDDVPLPRFHETICESGRKARVYKNIQVVYKNGVFASCKKRLHEG